jgi:uncharacterized GH25 family protein
MLGLLLLPSLGNAHEYWLEPSKTTAVAGDTITLRAYAGTGFRGEVKPYSPVRVIRFELHAPDQRDLSALAVNGDLDWARFVLSDDRGALIVYQSNFAYLELEGEKFDAYLRQEGLDEALAARAQRGITGPAREHYARCSKAWIAGSDVARVRAVHGLRHEIVPLDDPVHDARLRVRVLFDGKPRARALVRAWRSEDLHRGADRDSVGPATEARTGADGIATLEVNRPGEWLVSTVHIQASKTPHADWESWWSSLTFVRPRSKP